MQIRLTRRERTIMDTIEQIAAAKKTTKSAIVGRALGLKATTVRVHLHHIMRKAGVTDKAALLSWWQSQAPE